jgi:hypothetical protein
MTVRRSCTAYMKKPGSRNLVYPQHISSKPRASLRVRSMKPQVWGRYSFRYDTRSSPTAPRQEGRRCRLHPPPTLARKSERREVLRSLHPCILMTKRSKSGTTGMLLISQVSSERTIGIQRRGQDINFDTASLPPEARKTAERAPYNNPRRSRAGRNSDCLHLLCSS